MTRSTMTPGHSYGRADADVCTALIKCSTVDRAAFAGNRDGRRVGCQSNQGNQSLGLKPADVRSRSSPPRSASSRPECRPRFHPETRRSMFGRVAPVLPGDARAGSFRKADARGSRPSRMDDGMHYVRGSPGAAKSLVADRNLIFLRR